MYVLHITIKDQSRNRHLYSRYNFLGRGEKRQEWQLNKVVCKLQNGRRQAKISVYKISLK